MLKPKKDMKIVIEGREALNALGTADVRSYVAYRKNKEFVHLDSPAILMQHYAILPNIEKRMSYTSALVKYPEIQLPSYIILTVLV